MSKNEDNQLLHSGHTGSHEVHENDTLLDGHAVSPLELDRRKSGYLEGPPENWKRRSLCPLYPRDIVYHLIGKKFGGAFTHEPEDMMGGGSTPCCQLTPSTQRILRERVFHDLDPSEVVDYHVHIVGHGDSGSNCYIHKNLKTWWRPHRKVEAAVIMAAAQVTDEEGGDKQYISRLLRLVKQFVPSCVLGKDKRDTGELYKHHKLCLLAFDAFYEKDGRENRRKTTLYVPNDYVFSLVREFPQFFYAVGSVNPYRKDTLQELERCASNGVSIIKWLPNSMGIDLRDSHCVPFYRKMKELNMVLLVHIGEEFAMNTAFVDNSLGNPLFLRQPLKFGVKVIAAHCGTDGYAVDIESRERPRPKRPCFELFIRLMKEEVYKDLLFADISGTCGYMKVQYLAQLIEQTDIHDRLVYGSDYPIPAINTLIRPSKFQRVGLIDSDEKEALNELYNFNPLLFDLACKRLIKSSKGKGFPTSLFKEHPLLPPIRKTPFRTKIQDDARPRESIADDYDKYEMDQRHSPVEGVHQVLVEVEVYDEDSGSEHSHDLSPLRVLEDRGVGNRDRGQDEGEIEVEESNEETKLLLSNHS